MWLGHMFNPSGFDPNSSSYKVLPECSTSGVEVINSWGHTHTDSRGFVFTPIRTQTSRHKLKMHVCSGSHAAVYAHIHLGITKRLLACSSVLTDPLTNRRSLFTPHPAPLAPPLNSYTDTLTHSLLWPSRRMWKIHRKGGRQTLLCRLHLLTDAAMATAMALSVRTGAPTCT